MQALHNLYIQQSPPLIQFSAHNCIYNIMAQNSQQSLSSNAPSTKRARMAYACNYCNLTFPTAMALGGHQNAHRRVRALAQRPAGISLSYVPYPRINLNWPPANSIPPAEATSATAFGVKDYLGASSALESALSAIPNPVLPQLNFAPPVEATVTTVASPALDPAPSIGASRIVNVINLEDEEEEDELDLELKL